MDRGHEQLYSGLGIFVLGGANVEGITDHMICRDVTLRVLRVGTFIFGAGAPVFRAATPVVRGLVSTANGRGLFDSAIPVLALFGVVNIRARFRSVRRDVHRSVVSAFKGALVNVIRVVIIRGGARECALSGRDQGLHYQASPLFFHVSFGRANVGILSAGFRNLLLRVNQFYGVAMYLALLNCLNFDLVQDLRPPRLMRDIRIRERIMRLPFVADRKTVHVAIGLRRAICVVPSFFIVHVRGVDSVLVRVSTVRFPTMCISPAVEPFIGSRAAFPNPADLVDGGDARRSNARCRVVVLFRLWLRLVIRSFSVPLLEFLILLTFRPFFLNAFPPFVHPGPMLEHFLCRLLRFARRRHDRFVLKAALS